MNTEEVMDGISSKMERRLKLVVEAGDRLFAQLTALGCAEELASDICFALGQRIAMSGDDPQQLAEVALENYERGVWDVPGDELARKLAAEAWGDPPDPERMKEWLASL